MDRRASENKSDRALRPVDQSLGKVTHCRREVTTASLNRREGVACKWKPEAGTRRLSGPQESYWNGGTFQTTLRRVRIGVPVL